MALPASWAVVPLLRENDGHMRQPVAAAGEAVRGQMKQLTGRSPPRWASSTSASRTYWTTWKRAVPARPQAHQRCAPRRSAFRRSPGDFGLQRCSTADIVGTKLVLLPAFMRAAAVRCGVSDQWSRSYWPLGRRIDRAVPGSLVSYAATMGLVGLAGLRWAGAGQAGRATSCAAV